MSAAALQKVERVATFVKVSGGLFAPVDMNAQKMADMTKVGDGFQTTFKMARNLKFHRRFFALLRLGFDMWEPGRKARMFNGRPVEKVFEKYREDVLVRAGHFDVVYKLDDSFSLVARSIAFERCDEYEFVDVYEGALRVIWDNVLSASGFRSVKEVEGVIANLLRYE